MTGPDDDRREERQRVERVPGSRRAKLTPAPGTTAEPVAADERARPKKKGKTVPAPPPGADAPPGAAGRVGPAAARRAAASDQPSAGPNDERMRREVPPHY